MAIQDINPQFYIFDQFYNKHFYDDSVKNKTYGLFHSASVKYAQLNYMQSELEKALNEYNVKTEIYEYDRVRISALVESMLLYSKSALDLAINGLLTLTNQRNTIDSMNKFINKLRNKKEIDVPDIESKFNELLLELDQDEFSWLRYVLSRGSFRSLRDKVIHKQYIKITLNSSYKCNFC